jgi:hypothetical protein
VPEDFLVRGEVLLAFRHERVADPSLAIDQEHRRARDVPGVDRDPVPHAVRFRHLSRFVDQDVERQPAVFDVAPDRFRSLRENGDDLRAARAVFRGVFCQFTEPAAAVRSPGAAVKHQQHRTSAQELLERAPIALLRRQIEGGRRFRRGSRHLQNSFTSTISPASTMSVCAGISM